MMSWGGRPGRALIGCCCLVLGAAEPAAHGRPPIAAIGGGGGARQPQAAVGEDGRIYVTFGQGGAIGCAVSDDGGRTFKGPAEVGSVEALALGRRRGPRVAVVGGSVVITAIGGRLGGGRDGDLLAWRSADAGRTWAGPTRVNGVEGSAREGLHGMAAGPDGAVFCAWLDLRAGRTEIYGASSGDGGATWGPDRLVYRSPDRSVCECCHPSVAFAPDGALYVMWRNQVQGARDLYLARSRDGGRSFEPAEKLGRGTWPLDACPMDGGAIAAGPGGRVETVWMRAGAIYEARPGEPERRLGAGVQGWTALGPDGAYAVWLDGRPGRLVARIPGRSGPEALADRADDPVVAAAPGGAGPVIAVWEVASGAKGIASARLDRGP